MSGENSEDNKTIRTAATIGTSPLWVPAAAAGGIVYGAGKGMLALQSLPKDYFEKRFSYLLLITSLIVYS